MSARSARRPRIVRCPGCDKPLNDGQPLDHVTGDVGGWYQTSPGHFTRSRVEGQIGWHAQCLADFRAQNERLRVETELAQDIQVAASVAGSVTRERMAEIMRENGRSEDHIAAVLAAVEEGRTH